MSRFDRTETLLFSIELCFSLTVTTLFMVEYIDDFKRQIWANGGAEGWNSDPKQRIYFYANFKKPPDIPLIWTPAYDRRILQGDLLTDVNSPGSQGQMLPSQS